MHIIFLENHLHVLENKYFVFNDAIYIFLLHKVSFRCVVGCKNFSLKWKYQSYWGVSIKIIYQASEMRVIFTLGCSIYPFYWINRYPNIRVYHLALKLRLLVIGHICMHVILRDKRLGIDVAFERLQSTISKNGEFIF